MSTANLMDGLVAYADGKMISLRIPYPMGFYAKGFDGRIDDPRAGWKGRGLGVQRRPGALADGAGQGLEAPRRALPAAPGSAGEVAARPLPRPEQNVPAQAPTILTIVVFYSITRSARARNASGIVTPRWRAVRRFTISSN
jgi:hypothetical protein